MALSERIQTNEQVAKPGKEKPVLKAVESKPQELVVPERLKKTFEHVVSGDLYDAELSVSEYTAALRAQNLAKKNNDEGLVASSQEEIDKVVDDMNQTLRQFITDRLPPNRYGKTEIDSDMAMASLKEKGSIMFMNGLVKRPTWKKDFLATIENNYDISSEIKGRANIILTKQRMKASREKIAAIRGKRDTARDEVLATRKSAEAEENARNEAATAKENIKHYDKREIAVSGVDSFGSLKKLFKGYDVLIDKTGKVFDKDKTIKMLTLLEKQDIRPNSPLMSFLPDVYGMKDLVHRLVSAKNEGRKVVEDKVEIKEMKKDVKVLKNILSGNLGSAKWVQYGEFDFKSDKSGRVRYKDASVSGVPGTYMSKVLKAELEADLKDKEGVVSVVKKSKKDVPVDERVRDEDTAVVMQDNPGMSYEEASKIAEEKYGAESLIQERKDQTAKERADAEARFSRLQEELASAVDSAIDFRTLFDGLKTLEDIPYDNGSIVDAESMLTVLKKAEQSKSTIIRSSLISGMPKVVRDKANQYFAEHSKVVDDAKADQKSAKEKAKLDKKADKNKFKLDKKAALVQEQRKAEAASDEVTYQKGEGRMVEDIKARDEFLAINADIKAREESLVELLDLSDDKESFLQLLRQQGLESLKDSREYGANFDYLSSSDKRAVARIGKQLERLEKKASNINYDFDNVEAGDNEGLETGVAEQILPEAPSRREMRQDERAAKAVDRAEASTEKKIEKSHDERVREVEKIEAELKATEALLFGDMDTRDQYERANSAVNALEEKIVDMIDLTDSDIDRKTFLQELRQQGEAVLRKNPEFKVYFDSLSRKDRKVIKNIGKEIKKLEKKEASLDYDFINADAGDMMGLDAVALDRLRTEIKGMSRNQLIRAIEKKYHVDVQNPTDAERETINSLYQQDEKFLEMYKAASKGEDDDLERSAAKELRQEESKKPKAKKKGFLRGMFGR